jgi:chemosensory pili system protein ChpB (putative protein-glutamate methylesterase)
VVVEPATRVALLARPGAACDNLQAALRQAGADVVLVADPTSSDAGTVSASSPQAVLVALEPSIEDALERYSDILLDPATTVIYDEVALAARREGWDAARWSRHLAAKLGGHHDVLPPGADVDIAEAAIAPPAVAPSASMHVSEPEAADADLSLADDFDIDFGGLTDEMKAALAVDLDEALPAPPPPPETGTAHVLEWEPQSLPAPTPPAPVAATAAAPARFSLDEMALVEADVANTRTAAGGGKPSLDLDIPDEQGAVIVLAGIGGPDAVRQFLAALPTGFARPIIIRQRLDGGRHDRLVRQMQRATSLPVELAEAGARLATGHVYILPDGMATTQAAGVVTFAVTDGVVPVLAGLPAADSALLLLSGSDPAAVPEVLAAASAGALVAGQSPEECFDSAAPAALIAAGGESNPPAELARRLSTRWLSLKD